MWLLAGEGGWGRLLLLSDAGPEITVGHETRKSQDTLEPALASLTASTLTSCGRAGAPVTDTHTHTHTHTHLTQDSHIHTHT